MNTGQHWPPVHVDEEVMNGAKSTIERAKAGNNSAGMSVIIQSIVALRDVLETGTLPDKERVLYLKSLLESLDLIAGESVDPARALCIEKSRGRPRNPDKLARDLRIVMVIGRRYDELIERGHTREDSLMKEAIKQASNQLGESKATVQKVWSEYGSVHGWQRIRAAVK